MKNRWIAGVLATALLMTGVMPVYAAENQQSGTTAVKARVESTYTLTIPSNTNLSFGAENTAIGALSVTGNISPTQQVEVSAEKTDFVDETDAANTFSFDLLHDGQIFTGQIWSEAEVRAAQAVSALLTVHISEATWKNAKAGSYRAVLTFRAELK